MINDLVFGQFNFSLTDLDILLDMATFHGGGPPLAQQCALLTKGGRLSILSACVADKILD